jgi:murein L,D-transpeptidase YcbB/YkuD
MMPTDLPGGLERSPASVQPRGLDRLPAVAQAGGVEPSGAAEIPAASLDLPLPPAADVTITAADRLQGAIAARIGDALRDVSPRLPRREREAIAASYAESGYAPLWVKDGAWNPAANRLIAQLRSAEEDGLESVDYRIPAVASTRGEPVEDWAEAEIRLSAAAVLYARDARGGRIEPSRLSGYLTPKLSLPDAGEVLSALKGSPDAGAVLARFQPQHPGYRALKAKLAEVRQNRPAAPMVRVPVGPPLKVGMRDPRVPLVRARFGLGPVGDETSYDERVASAVAAFQRERGLPANGVLTPKTVAALSGPSAAQLDDDLVANMERWRWLPADLGARHIFVNIPEYRLRLIEGGHAVHQTRVVVGKTESQTPIFSDEMEHVIVNPSWTVPPSIMKKEFLPALARDPSYAARRGYEVIRRNGQISVRQPPGERNALGYVKFIFPNDHSVYLHDTPSRSLFGAERRAFSHGCVRVDQPFRLAEEVLRGQGSWSEERLKGLVGKGERYIRLQEKLPVHLSYFTLSVDEHGQLKRFEDIYGHHAKVRAALGLGA